MSEEQAAPKRPDEILDETRAAIERAAAAIEQAVESFAALSVALRDFPPEGKS